MAPRILPPEERFMSRVEPEPMSGCWLWTGGTFSDGYGAFSLGLRSAGNLRSMQAHRAAWILFRGEIEPGMKILHLCDNRACVNPDHLKPGTQLDNMRDMARKERGCKSSLDLPYGVSKLRGHVRLPYQARISVNGANVSLGVYATPEEASSAAKAARDAAISAGNR